MPVTGNHQHAALMTGSAQNHLWHLLTSALDKAMQLMPAFRFYSFYKHLFISTLCFKRMVYELIYAVFVDKYSFLAKRGVKEEIQTFDARKITPETRKAVEDLLRKNRESFDPKVSIEITKLNMMFCCIQAVSISH